MFSFVILDFLLSKSLQLSHIDKVNPSFAGCKANGFYSIIQTGAYNQLQAVKEMDAFLSLLTGGVRVGAETLQVSFAHLPKATRDQECFVQLTIPVGISRSLESSRSKDNSGNEHLNW